MKKNYILLVFFLFSLQIIGQTNLNWGFAIGSKESENSGSFVTDSYGNIISTYYGKDSVDVDPSPNTKIIVGLKGSMMLNKFDKNGKYIWTRQFVDSIGLGFNTSYVYPNNDLLITGSFTKNLYLSDGVNQQRIALVPNSAFALIRMDEHGGIVWIKTYTSTGSAYLNDIISLKDGNLMFCGAYYGKLTLKDNVELTNSGKSDAMIGIINSLGNIINYKTYGSTQYDYVSNLSIRSDNEISFGISADTSINISVNGAVRSFNTSKNTIYIYGYMNKKLDIQFAQSIEATGGDAYGEGHILDENQNYYIYGYFQGSIQFDPKNASNHKYKAIEDGDAYIVKYDREGRILWSNVYPSKDYANIHLLKLHNNYLYAGGNFSTSIDLDPGMDSIPIYNSDGMLLLKLDLAGKLIWHNEFLSDDNAGMRNMVVDSENNITCYGYFYAKMDIDPSNKEYFIAPKRDRYANAFLFSLKETHVTDVADTPSDETIFKLSQTSCHIQISSELTMENLQIYNSVGNLFYSKNNIKDTQIVIPTDHYNPGIYFIHVEVGGKLKTLKVLVAR